MNPALLHLAQRRVWTDMEKVAVVAPGGDPAAMGGDPAAMGGGMPPGGGGMPPGAPPMDPAMMGGGAPPMDPAMMGGGMPPQGGAPAAPPMDPAMMGGGMPGAMPGAAPQKLKPEQMMQMLDFRLYNMQQQITALMNHTGASVAPGALVTPPGSPTPVAEAAVPGGPMDPGAAAGGADPAAAGGGSAISGIDPIQGASPELAGGGGEKAAAFSPLMAELFNDDTPTGFSGVGQPFTDMFGGSNVTTNATAVAALLRRRTAGVA